MNMTPPPGRALAPILGQNIEYYGEFVDIVEQPDVGALTVPESIVEILDEAISVMLNYCMIHHVKAVRIKYEESERGRLKLEVRAEHMQSTMPPYYRLIELNIWASRRFGGEFVYGEDVHGDDTASIFFMRLHLPIPS